MALSVSRPNPLAAAVRLTLIGYLASLSVAPLAHAEQTPGTTSSESSVAAPEPKKDGAEEAPTLPTVNVKASAQPADSLPAPYAGGQAARGGRLGLLGNTNVMNAPFNITSYTAQTIEDQQAATVADVAGKDPSVRMTGQTGGILDAFFIRGFAIGEGNVGELAFDGVYGAAPNYRVFADYAERIEVIKGPAALLYGMAPNSGIGGVINIVPKRAADTDLTRFTADYASASQLGGHVDVGRRFGGDKQFGARFNGSYHNGDTPLDNQSREAHVGSIGLDYRGTQLRASLDVINQREKFDAPSRPFLIANGVDVPAAPDGRRNVTQAWEWSDIEDQSHLARVEYDVSEKVTLFADVGGAESQVDRLFGTPTIQNAAGDTSSTPGYFKFDVERSTADVGVRTKFDTAAIRHTVTLQASRYEDSLSRGSTNGTAVQSNIYAPVDRTEQNVAAPTSVPKISESELTGTALADTLSMYDERVQLTLGVRRQQVKSDNFNPTTGAVTSSYDKSATTPLVGLVVKTSKNVSLYANHIEGLSKGDIAPSTASNAGEVFEPYKAEQNEIGAKVDHGRLITTVSAFEITKPSGQMTGSVFAVDAEQRNRGFEFNMFGEVTPSVRLLGGVTFLDAELTQTNSAATQGKTPVGVPSRQANLRAEWDTSWVSGLTLAGSVNYTDEQFIDQANTRQLPAWTTFDLGARYSTKLSARPVVFRANIQNLLDRDYWSGVASWGGFVQGAPRTLQLSATMDF